MGKHTVSFYQTKKKSIDGSVVAHQTDEVTVPDSIPESHCEEERKKSREDRQGYLCHRVQYNEAVGHLETLE